MSETLIEILSELRAIRATLERIPNVEPADERPTPEEERRRVVVLATWHARVQDRVLTTREVVALGVEGMPSGSLRAVAQELGRWAGPRYRVIGGSTSYGLRRTQSHGQAAWQVTR